MGFPIPRSGIRQIIKKNHIREISIINIMAPKKSKKSKAELEEEKLAREEEERKIKALEDKKRAEEEEKKRIEELRIQAEKKVLRGLEIERLTNEHNEYLDDKSSRNHQLNAEEKNEALNVEWLRYKDPTDEPDAFVERDMNTFITQLKESSTTDLKDTMELIKKSERVTESLETVWCESLARKDVKMQKQIIDNLESIRSIVFEKLDAATIKILQIADTLLNDRVEFNIEEISSQWSLGMWATYNDIRPIRKSLQLEKLGIQLDIPKQLLSQNEKFIYRLIRIPVVTYNFTSYSETDLGLMKNKCVVGDMIQFDILLPTPLSFYLRAKKWTIRDKTSQSTSLRKSHYPSSVACRMFLKIPDNVVMTEDIRAAIWDETSKDWVEEGITDYQYSEMTRTAQFYITTVGLIALVRPSGIDFPYKKWLLTPIHEGRQNNDTAALISTANSSSASVESKSNSIFPSMYEKQARFTMQSQQLEIVIDIIGSKCRLLRPVSKQFEDLIGVLLSPGSLLVKLQKKGVNLLPTKLDLSVVDGVKEKNESLEAQVISDISRGASSLEIFSSAAWNQKICNQSQIGVCIRETCLYTCPSEHFEFECILAETDDISTTYLETPDLGLLPGSGVKYLLVFGNEYGTKKQEYSHKSRPGEETHMIFSKSFEKKVTGEAMQRYKGASLRLEKTVNILLSLIKPYSLT